MSANNALHIAVLGGDGIGPEVMAPAIEVLRRIEATSDLKFRFTEAPAGANNYLATGKSMPDSTIRLCEEAAVRVFVPPGRTPQGAREGEWRIDLRRQGECVQGVCVLSRDVR